MEMRKVNTLLAFILAAVVPGAALAQSYTFTQIEPLGGSFPFYFEPAALDGSGELLFAPSLNTGGEGVFLWTRGQLTAVALGGQTMPDGGVLGYTLSPVS